jgi:hypothetical protein
MPQLSTQLNNNSPNNNNYNNSRKAIGYNNSNNNNNNNNNNNEGDNVPSSKKKKIPSDLELSKKKFVPGISNQLNNFVIKRKKLWCWQGGFFAMTKSARLQLEQEIGSKNKHYYAIKNKVKLI